MESYEKKQEKINKKSEARRKKMIERKAKELNEIKKKIQVKEESLKTNPDYEMEIRQELAEFKEQETKLTRELDELKKINTNDNTLRIRDDVDIGDGIANEESFNRYMNQKFRKEFAIHLSLEEEASWDSIERKIDENFELIKRNIGGVKVEESLKTEILRKIDEHKNLIKKAIEDFRN
ncbi:MAG: hypothetical protein LBU14_05165 [Candidatus Peribacteria bacterium]|nr:hypothetical protein [Candidatus Peribacteria bacterium]